MQKDSPTLRWLLPPHDPSGKGRDGSLLLVCRRGPPHCYPAIPGIFLRFCVTAVTGGADFGAAYPRIVCVITPLNSRATCPIFRVLCLLPPWALMVAMARMVTRRPNHATSAAGSLHRLPIVANIVCAWRRPSGKAPATVEADRSSVR